MSLSVVIIGCGARGGETYGRYFHNSSKVEIKALVDTNKLRLDSFRKEFSIDSDRCFLDAESLFKLGKIADLCVVSVIDQDHYKIAMRAMELGYDLLLEKPISVNLKECLEIRDYAVKHHRVVTVCHVMRYTSYYRYLKRQLSLGVIGTIMGIEQTEDVAYWHMAHGFVRGNFNNSNSSSPMILQKCCHDMDLLVYLTGEKPKKISSFGSLRYFKEENAPIGSSDRCINCQIKDCPFNAVDFYLANVKELIRTNRNTNVWPYSQVALNPNEENILQSLKETSWGKCVFKSANNVVDHEFSLIEFANGLVGALTMIGFSSDGGRQTHVYGTKGEIFLNEQDQTITTKLFGKEKKVVNFMELSEDFSGHGGGDKVMLDEMLDSLINKKTSINSDISKSIDSHIMCFSAEESRINNGKVIDLKEFENSVMSGGQK